MNEYELVVVAQPELDEDGMTALNDPIADWIKTAQGEISATEVWGRRQLAMSRRGLAQSGARAEPDYYRCAQSWPLRATEPALALAVLRHDSVGSVDLP